MMFISQKLYKREPSSKVGRRVVKPVFIERLTSEAYGTVRMDVILCSLQLLTGPGTRIPVICRVTLKPLSNTVWPALSYLCGIQVLLFSAFFFFFGIALPCLFKESPWSRSCFQCRQYTIHLYLLVVA